MLTGLQLAYSQGEIVNPNFNIMITYDDMDIVHQNYSIMNYKGCQYKQLKQR